jgi:hypothetical protein
VVEDVVEVVLGFHLHQPVVDAGAVGVADTTWVFVGAEEVDVDAVAVAVEGGEEAPAMSASWARSCNWPRDTD